MPEYDYQLGAQVRCSAIFVNADGDEDDPTAVTFYQRDPEGVTTEYIYDTDPEVVRTAAGRYYVLVTASMSRTWTYRFEGTGDVVAADETTFTVAPSVF